jgi:hypothetical protein
VTRVLQGYTEGRDGQHRTRTCVHRTLTGMDCIPTRAIYGYSGFPAWVVYTGTRGFPCKSTQTYAFGNSYESSRITTCSSSTHPHHLNTTRAPLDDTARLHHLNTTRAAVRLTSTNFAAPHLLISTLRRHTHPRHLNMTRAPADDTIHPHHPNTMWAPLGDIQ